MTIYINSDYRCCTQPGEGLRAVFAGKTDRAAEIYESMEV